MPKDGKIGEYLLVQTSDGRMVVLTSGKVIKSLNADLLDGKHSGEFANASLEQELEGLRSQVGNLTFIGLTDVPDSYAGSAGKILVVKSTENGIEFVTLPDITATIKEIPTGLINGVNTVYILSHAYLSGTVRVWLNGLKLQVGEDYEEDPGNQSFIMAYPPSNTGFTDLLEVEYNIDL